VISTIKIKVKNIIQLLFIFIITFELYIFNSLASCETCNIVIFYVNSKLSLNILHRKKSPYDHAYNVLLEWYNAVTDVSSQHTQTQADGFTILIFEVMIYEVCKLYFQSYYNNLNEYNITFIYLILYSL